MFDDIQDTKVTKWFVNIIYGNSTISDLYFIDSEWSGKKFIFLKNDTYKLS